MLFSYKTLSTLVDLTSITPEELRNRLTFSGFEVEGMEKLAEASSLVIGEVLTCEKHPDSDHLHVLTVDCGQEGIKHIVCGAPNVRKGLRVIVALEGCVLPALGETIKKGKIRGEVSEGMCCSLLELGVSKDSLEENSPSMNGIEELPFDAPLGEKNVLDYLGLNDTILDINVLPNRPDCLSYIGMAREISALMNRPLVHLPTYNLASLKDNIHVRSKTINCPRIDMLRINDVVVKKETPLYIKRTLLASGIRSLSPLVDLGNYSMLLTGQPLNIYDADDNTGDDYIVSDDYQGKFTTFDGKEIDLIPGDLVISDKSSVICLAGIMAGEKASVRPSTRNITIEAACFYHANIRHTSSRLGLSSFSSQLFSKERNPKLITEALAVTISLLPEFLESYELTSYSSFNRSEMTNEPFPFSLEALNARLGSSYTEEEVDEVLAAYRIEKREDGTIVPPLDRVDLKEQCDIDEEVFRYFPATRITPSLKDFPITQGHLSDEQKKKREIRELLVSRGLDEILSFTLISEKEDTSIRVFSKDEGFKIINPMTKDHEIVRSDLLPSLIATVDYNKAHQNKNLALFEISPIDTPKGNHLYLSIALCGEKMGRDEYMSRPYDFFDLKGYVYAVLRKIGLTDSRFCIAYSKNEKFHPNCSADIFVGKDLVGTFGQLHPSFYEDKLFVAELDLGKLLSLKGMNTKFASFSSFPEVRRDLSFRMNDKVDYALLKKTILHIKDTNVRDVCLFDEFTDKLTGITYLGVSVFLGKEDGTLKDNEITSSIKKITDACKSELGLTLKGE